MNTITFDTLASAKRLKAKGVKSEDAEAFAEELKAANDTDISHLATKEEIVVFKSEMKADFEALRKDVKLEVAEAKTEVIKYMFTGFVAVIGLLVAILFKH
ncbi:MAG: hypothetical protein WCJ33_06870 [Pseudomonadota bacterium]